MSLSETKHVHGWVVRPPQQLGQTLIKMEQYGQYVYM